MAVVRTRVASFSFALLAVAAVLAFLPSADAGTTLDTGVTTVGIRDDGALGICCGPPSLTSGTNYVGLRLSSNQAEGAAVGCICEGWSVAHSGVVGTGTLYSPHGLDGTTFATTPTGAVSTTNVGSLRVEHAFAPASASSSLVQVEVTLTNTGSTAIDSVRYRRALDFDAEPTPFREFVTMRAGTLPPEFEFSCTNGFATSIASYPDPCPDGSTTYVHGPPKGAGFTDRGPQDHGALLQLRSGSLAPGASWSFQLFFGAAPSQADAEGAVAAAGAVWYAFAQPDTTDGPSAGRPVTFILAWSGAGTPPPPPPPPCSGAVPGTVTDLAATVDGNRATITWSLPPPGDCPIETLALEIRHPGGTFHPVGSFTDTATSHSMMVPYCSAPEFRIRARSEAGYGPYGHGTTTTVGKPPMGAPYLFVQDLDADTNRVQWFLYDSPSSPCAADTIEVHRDGAVLATMASPSKPWVFQTHDDRPIGDCAVHTYLIVAVNGYGRTATPRAVTHQHGWYEETPVGTQKLSCSGIYCITPAPGAVCPTPMPACSVASGEAALGQEGLTLQGGASEQGLRAGYVKSPEDPSADPVESASATWQSCGVAPGCLAGNTHLKLGLLGLDVKVEWESGMVTVAPRDGGPTSVKDNTKVTCA